MATSPSISISNVRRLDADRFTFSVDVPGDDALTLNGFMLAWSPGRWLCHSPHVRLASGGQVEAVTTTPATKKLLRDLVIDFLTSVDAL